MLHIPHYERNLQDYIYEDIQADGRPIVIYGAGEIGRLTAGLLKEHGIEPYVDLIKMDIEGAEMHALSGAQETIRRCHPVLAIAVYHKAEDLVTIPQYIKTFETKDVKYRFCLRKHQIFSEMELDLYALPERR